MEDDDDLSAVGQRAGNARVSSAGFAMAGRAFWRAGSGDGRAGGKERTKMDRRPTFLASLVCSSMTSAIHSRPLADEGTGRDDDDGRGSGSALRRTAPHEHQARRDTLRLTERERHEDEADDGGEVRD